MRLKTLRLTRYGNFSDTLVRFDTRPGCINLLIAPNGAGKSVLRTAFGDLLFNIHGQTPMGFRHGYPGMRISADIAAPDGTQITLRRRKGQGSTLLDANDQPHPPALLASLLGQTDRAQLERLFALDTERLRRGGDDLLASGGAFADALLSAGGLRHARALARELESAADALAPLRKVAARPFYVELDRLAEARRRANTSLLKPEDWQRLHQALNEFEAAREALNEASRQASRRIAQLHRIRRVRTPLAELDAATAWLDAHPDAPELPASLAEVLNEAVSQRGLATQKLDDETARHQDLSRQASAIAADTALLDAAGEIDRLAARAGGVAKSAADLPGLSAQQRGIVARMMEALQRLGSNLPTERARDLVPTRAVEARLRHLIARHQAVSAPLARAPAEAARLQAQIAQTAQDLAALPPAVDVAGLAPLIREIQADGDPAIRARDAEAAATHAWASLQAALALVPGWHGDAETLIAVAPATDAEYDRLDTARARAAEALARQEERAREAEELRARKARELGALTDGGAVIDAAEVARARQVRDLGWHLIYRIAFTPEPPGAEEQAAFAGGQPLPLAYEQAVRRADALADQRVASSDLLAATTAGRAALRDAEAQSVSAQSELAAPRALAVATAAAWREICAGLGRPDGVPIDEVRAFLAARARVVERQAACRQAAQAREALARQHAAWAARLAAAMGLPEADHPLPALLGQALQRRETAERISAERREFQATHREQERQQAEQAASLAAARQDVAEWQSEWEAALAALGRPAGETPAVTADILTLLADLDADRKEAGSLDERIKAIYRDHGAFSQDVTGLLARVAPGTAPPDRDIGAMLAEATRLAKRLGDARTDATRRDQLLQQLADAERHLAGHRDALARRDVALATILATIGADSVPGAEARLAASREQAAHVAGRNQAQARLIELGDGMGIEQLRAELAGIAADDLDAALRDAEATCETANAAAQERAGEAARLSGDLARREADDGFEAASADRQSAAATLSRVLDEALRYRLAALLLDHGLRGVEGQDTPAILNRVAFYLNTLTCGAYDRVAVAEDDGLSGLVMRLIPQDLPDEQKRVADLSEGTRDQLYLALRMTAIEEHVRAAPALPFLGDDILQTSDDRRATAALRALVDLSRHTQVILLTHHAHLGALAAELPAGAVHLCSLDMPEDAAGVAPAA